MERSPWTESDAAELAYLKKKQKKNLNNSQNKVTKATTSRLSKKKKKYKIEKSEKKKGFILARIDTKWYKLFVFQIKFIFIIAKILFKSSRSDGRVKFISNIKKKSKQRFTALDSWDGLQDPALVPAPSSSPWSLNHSSRWPVSSALVCRLFSEGGGELRTFVNNQKQKSSKNGRPLRVALWENGGTEVEKQKKEESASRVWTDDDVAGLFLTRHIVVAFLCWIFHCCCCCWLSVSERDSSPSKLLPLAPPLRPMDHRGNEEH